jgi:integrase
MPPPSKHAFAFNDRSIKALRPGAVQTDYMDLSLEGFGLRVYPSGRKTFFRRYRVGRGGFRRLSLGTYPKVSLKKARRLAAAAVGRVATGEDPQAERRERRQGPTFGELAATFMAVHSKKRKRTWREDQRILDRELLPAWKHLPSSEIRRRDIAAVLEGVVGRDAPIMANRVRALISKIFAFALEREIVEFNPVHGLKAPTAERKRERFLSADEVSRLWGMWEAENSVTSAVFRMLLVTAQRLGEVLTMRWEDIEGEWWTIPPGITKNARGHRVYLGAEAQELLGVLRLRPDKCGWVFPSPRTSTRIVSVNKAAERYRSASGTSGWTPHDLRRTAATYMGDLEVPDAIIALVLNHASTGVTARYNRSRREREIARALGLWGTRLAEMARGRSVAENIVRFDRAER